MSEPRIPDELRHAPEVRVPAGARVFRQGEFAENYLLVTSGSVRVFARSDAGREVVLYRVGPGEMCTLTTACLLGRTSYPAEAIAEAESVARIVPAGEFERLVDESAGFRVFVFASFSGRLNEIMRRLELLVLSSVDRKLAAHLLEHADAQGVVRSTHDNLALEIGTAREVVSRHLKALESRGCLELRRGAIRITNRSALRELD
jgi:CRP/FNR family transcriptional regulator